MSENEREEAEPTNGAAMAAQTEDGRVILVTPEGMAVERAPEKGGTDGEGETDGEDQAASIADLVSQPDKVMRIGTMTRTLLAELKSAPLDEASRQRLRNIHRTSIAELKEGISAELAEELERLAQPFEADTPSDAELRIAQAQLVGWLEGLFQGIQTTLVAQQMASRAQLEQMRRALPQGSHPTGGSGSGGMYL